MYDFEQMDKRLIIFGNLFRTANRLQTVMDNEMEGLTAKQWFVILMLGMFDKPPTLKQLALMCDSSHQNIKQIILKLQARGFVKIETDLTDARAMRITATEKCAEWDSLNRDAAQRFVDTMFSSLSLEEINITSNSLLKIYNKLGEIQNEK